MFTSIDTARAFALAGNALLTLSSLRTGVHFTYKIQLARNDPEHTRNANRPLWFVKLLTDGSADEGVFVYIGMIRDGRFTLTRGSKAGSEAPSVKAFKIFMELPAMHPQLEIRHEGHCGRCGRTLTVPESIDAGIGPECIKMMS